MIVESVKGIEPWQGHVPPKERRQSKEVGPGLYDQANQYQDPDRTRLPHQGRVLIDARLRRGVPKALLPDKVHFSRHRYLLPICLRCYQETDADAIKENAAAAVRSPLRIKFSAGCKIILTK